MPLLLLLHSARDEAQTLSFLISWWGSVLIKLGQEAVVSEEDMLASPLRVMVITLFMVVVKEEINGVFFFFSSFPGRLDI